MSRLVVAALTLLLTVGALFGAAAWNRGGDVQSIVLTERELALPWNWPNADGPPRLRFEWERRTEAQDARLWLTDLKLRELGFTTGVAAGAPEAEQFYRRSLPRLAWVAFEMDGAAWRAIEQRLSMTSAATRFGTLPRDRSHLVPIDAGPDLDTLMRRYPNQPVVVLRAVVEMRFQASPKEGPSVWGEVTSLVTSEVTIPAALRGRLPATARRSTSPPDPSGQTPAALEDPRYEVELRVGRLGTAWVHDVRKATIDQSLNYQSSMGPPLPQQALRDRLQLHIGGPLVYLAYLRVAVQLLHGVVLDEAVAAEQVDGHRGHALGGL